MPLDLLKTLFKCPERNIISTSSSTSLRWQISREYTVLLIDKTDNCPILQANISKVLVFANGQSFNTTVNETRYSNQ